MKWLSFGNWLLLVLLSPLVLSAQQDPLAPLKASLSKNLQSLQTYSWVETTTISVKGEVKSQVQKKCQFGPDGKVQKQEITATPEEKGPHGLRGKVVANKKEDMSDYMQRAVSLIRGYVPPAPDDLQNAKLRGDVNLEQPGANTVRIAFHDFQQPKDELSIDVNPGTKALVKLYVNSNLDMDTFKDPVTLNTTFGTLPDGTSYPANSVLVAPVKKIKIEVQNSNYEKRSFEQTPSLMQMENASPRK